MSVAGRLKGPIFVRVFSFLMGRWGLLLELMVIGAILLVVPGIRQPIAQLVGAVSSGDGPAIRDLIQSYGLLAPVVSVALILLHTVVPLPAELLTLANGFAFGFWGGLVLSWTGFMLSALILYAAGRLWGRPLLERTVPARHRRRLDGWLEQESVFPLLAVRLIPLVPFNVIGIAAGAVRAPLWAYTWTTGLGILPLGVTVTFLGSRLGKERPQPGIFFWVISALLLAVVLAAWWLNRRRSRKPR